MILYRFFIFFLGYDDLKNRCTFLANVVHHLFEDKFMIRINFFIRLFLKKNCFHASLLFVIEPLSISNARYQFIILMKSKDGYIYSTILILK